jgi:polyphosphate kinase 2 (PPK2 family)
MALKAMYLGALNYLSARELVSVRRWKSGLDYRRELTRRARAKPELPPAFDRSVAIFERGWYGRHTVDRAMAESLANGLKEMRASAK